MILKRVRPVKDVVYPRVHMFSLDLSLLNGNMKSGSMGCSLFDFPITIEVKQAKDDRVRIDGGLSGAEQKLKRMLNDFRQREHRHKHYHIAITTPRTLREHIGLGSTTQICVGVLKSLYKLEKLGFNIDKLLRYNMGTQSACGAQLALNPGCIIEYGYKRDDAGVCLHPELYNYKEKFEKITTKIPYCGWMLILAIPHQLHSISGEVEDAFWEQNYPDSADNTLWIHYYLSEYILPGVTQADFLRFIYGMKKVTEIGTKPKEEDLQCLETKNCLKDLRDQFGFAAISSLGPTIYAFSTDADCQLLPRNEYYEFYKIPFGEYR